MRARSLAGKLALLLLSVAAGAVLLEAAIRLFDLFPRPRRLVSAEPAATQRSADEPALSTVVHPYLGWSRRPAAALQSLVPLQRTFPDGPPSDWYRRNNRANAFGFRSEIEDYREVGEEDFVIGIFGGSVANQLALLGGDTIVAALSQRRPELGGKIRILNFGLGGYKQPQQTILLLEMILLGVPFDVVVNLDGFNEVALGAGDAAAGHHPIFPHRPHHLRTVEFSSGQPTHAAIELSAAILKARRESRRWREWLGAGPGRSALVAALVGLRLQALARRAAEAEHALQYPSGTGQVPAMARIDAPCLSGGAGCWRLIADLWERSSLAMAALARAEGALYLHLLQPHQYLKGSKRLTAEERRVAYAPRHPWSRAVARGYPHLRRRVPLLLQAGVRFHDLTGAFRSRTETLYEDSCCHFNSRGGRILGAEVARLIDESVSPPPSDSQ
jgi:hypothetical protein